MAMRKYIERKHLRGFLLMLAFIFLCFMPRSLAHADQRSVTFNIPAQPMEAALLQFSEQARVQLIVAVDPKQLPDSAGVFGVYAPDEALGRLIEGAALEYYFTSGNTVTVRRRQPAPLVTAPPM